MCQILRYTYIACFGVRKYPGGKPVIICIIETLIFFDRLLLLSLDLLTWIGCLSLRTARMRLYQFFLLHYMKSILPDF